MATQYGFGKITTDGLVLCLDAGNPRSYSSGSTTWFDLSGNGNSGSLMNGPAYTGSYGGAIVFDGVDDYVTGSPTTINSTITDSITIESFVLFNSPTTNYQVIGGGQDNIVARYSTSFNISANADSKTGFDIEAAGGQIRLSSTLPANPDQWYHLVGTYDGTTSRYYVNSILQSTSTGTSGSVVDWDSFLLGRDISFVTGRALSGRIANYKVYNRALSAQEIKQNYNATKTRFGL